MTPKAGDAIQMDELGHCICGAKIAINVEEMAVMHDVPTCLAFDRMDTLEYVTWLRRARGIPDSMVDEN